MKTDPSQSSVHAPVPPVPSEYTQRPLSRAWLLSYLLSALLIVVGAIWCTQWATALLRSHPGRSILTPIAVVPTPTSQIDCPLLPLLEGDHPTLGFCSPLYLGNVAGSFGVRIILVGKNFSALPDQWFLSEKDLSKVTSLSTCLKNKMRQCPVEKLRPPAMEERDGFFLASWIWQSPSTPGNYSILARSGDELAVGKLQFTLLTAQPPCIAISLQVQRPDCSRQETLSLKSGATIYIQGTNWMLGWGDEAEFTEFSMQVEVVATCLSDCDWPQLFARAVLLRPDGSFSITLSLPTGIGGTYIVEAWNRLTPAGAPGGEENTVADAALTFGLNSSLLTLQMP